ncbi:SUKH-3 domain-containing protein [Streptosporangium sp. NPDC051022]|uniref:SUKH-3 domain-containing protein n=1 Tax=Streptosporangium sp. NPDC051022 TaxID=3155752 RepID=UPI00341B0550
MVSDEQFATVSGSAGWFPSRGADTRAAADIWAQVGHTSSRAAEEFVAEFDGLSIAYPRHPSVGGEDRCVLDAVLATRSIHPATVRSYERRVSETLCPVGTAASSHLTLMVTPSGRVYGGYDAFLALYGESGRDAIWNICHRIRGVPVPD